MLAATLEKGNVSWPSQFPEPAGIWVWDSPCPRPRFSYRNSSPVSKNFQIPPLSRKIARQHWMWRSRPSLCWVYCTTKVFLDSCPWEHLKSPCQDTWRKIGRSFWDLDISLNERNLSHTPYIWPPASSAPSPVTPLIYWVCRLWWILLHFSLLECSLGKIQQSHSPSLCFIC